MDNVLVNRRSAKHLAVLLFTVFSANIIYFIQNYNLTLLMPNCIITSSAIPSTTYKSEVIIMKNSVQVKVSKETNTVYLRFKDISSPMDFSQLVKNLRNSVKEAKWIPEIGWQIPFTELASIMEFCYGHFPVEQVQIILPGQVRQLNMRL